MPPKDGDEEMFLDWSNRVENTLDVILPGDWETEEGKKKRIESLWKTCGHF